MPTLSQLRKKLDGRIAGFPDGSVVCDLCNDDIEDTVYLYIGWRSSSLQPTVRLMCDDCSMDDIESPTPGAAELVGTIEIETTNNQTFLKGETLDITESIGFEKEEDNG